MNDTRNHIKVNLLDALKTQGLDSLSVSKLCQKAHISRSTFYFYYQDKYELFSEIQEEIISYLSQGLEPGQVDLSQLDQRDFKNFLTYYSKALFYIKQDLSLLLQADPKLFKEIPEILYQSVINSARRLAQKNLPQDYYFFMKYIVGAIWSVSVDTLDDHQITEKKFLTLLYEINLNPMHHANQLLQ